MAKSELTPTFTILDDVEKCEKEVVEGLLTVPDRRPVRLVINSGGGSVYASLGIGTVLKMKQLQAEAVVLADCSSSALLVFAACKVRRVAPHASFLFHPMKWTSEDQSRLPAAQSWSTEFHRVSRVCEDWLVENLPIQRRLLRNWLKAEKYVEASTLFELGIAEPLRMEDVEVIDIAARRRSARRTSAAAERPARLRRAG